MTLKGKLDLGFELTVVALISENFDQAQELLSNVESQALKIGLKIN